MRSIRVISHVSLADLSEDVADSCTSDQLLEFILLLDAQMADLDFTQRLYAAIGDELRKELEADERT